MEFRYLLKSLDSDTSKMPEQVSPSGAPATANEEFS